MTPAAVITAAPDTLLVIAPPDFIDRLAVIAQALIDAHAGAPAAGDCAAAGKCLRRYPPPPDDAPAPQPPDTPAPQIAPQPDTDGNDAGLCAAIAKVSGNRCRRLANAGTRYCHYHTPAPAPDTPDTPAQDVPPDTPTLADTPAPAPAPAPQPDGDDSGNDAGNDAGNDTGAGVAPWVIAAAGCRQPLDCLQPDCLSYRTGQCNPDGIPGHLRRQPPTTAATATATATPAATTPAPAPPVGAGATATPAATASAGPCPHCGAGPAMRQRDGDGHLRCLACARYWDPPPLSAAAAAADRADRADRAGYHRAAPPRVAAAAA